MTKLEYENSFNRLIERYNTTVMENRFIAGGAVEVFTCALLRTVGTECTLYGSQSNHGDIILPHKKLLSIKGIFKGGVQDVILLNKQGGGTREWITATIFVISEVGLVFGTPEMVDNQYIKDRSDALILKKKAILNIMENGNNVIHMNLNRKPPPDMTGFSHKASVAVAKQIMHETESKTLLNMYYQDASAPAYPKQLKNNETIN